MVARSLLFVKGRVCPESARFPVEADKGDRARMPANSKQGCKKDALETGRGGATGTFLLEMMRELQYEKQ
jgi:hypothetical protein